MPNANSKYKVGDKIGRLTITEHIGSKHRNPLWRCQCECGNWIDVTSGKLITKKTLSCGCLRRDTTSIKRWKGVGDLSRSYWNGVLRNAHNRGVEVSLTIEEAWKLFQDQQALCAISGLPISFVDEKGHRGYGSASLDRIDNSRGYTKDNCWWVHKHINIMKKEHTLEYFKHLCSCVASAR